MSTYIMSDIHGDMEAFNKMLELIGFKSGQDFLIINGDVLDRGKYGIELLMIIKDMVEKGDALMIKGDHEYYAQMYLEGMLSESDWIRYFGAYTLESIKKLDKASQNLILEYIKSLPLFVEKVFPRLGKTVITHNGLKNGDIINNKDDGIDVAASLNKSVESDEYGLLISADIHYWPYETLFKLDRFIICGHIPTYQLGPEYTGKILRARKYMDIDAGAGHRNTGGKLACYRIEDDKEFYV